MKKTNTAKKEFTKQVKERLQEFRQFESVLKTDWGGNERFNQLLTLDTKLKLQKAQYIFKKAWHKKDSDHMNKMIDMMYRAYNAVIEELQELGYKKLEPHIRCFKWNGELWYVTDMDYEMPRARIISGDSKSNYISIQELMRCIPKELMELRILLAKQFEGSKFEKVEMIDANKTKTKSNS